MDSFDILKTLTLNLLLVYSSTNVYNSFYELIAIRNSSLDLVFFIYSVIIKINTSSVKRFLIVFYEFLIIFTI